MGGPIITINLALLLGIVIWVRLRRPTEPRKRSDEVMTVVIVAVFGILIAPTEFGQWVWTNLQDMAAGVTGLGL